MSESLLIPLHLAELLHATLGTLTDVLDEDGHPWAPLARRVVESYEQARGDSAGIRHYERFAIEGLTDLIRSDMWADGSQ